MCCFVCCMLRMAAISICWCWREMYCMNYCLLNRTIANQQHQTTARVIFIHLYIDIHMVDRSSVQVDRYLLDGSSGAGGRGDKLDAAPGNDIGGTVAIETLLALLIGLSVGGERAPTEGDRALERW